MGKVKLTTTRLLSRNLESQSIFQFSLKLLDPSDLLRIEDKFLAPKRNIPVKTHSALNHERVLGGGQGTNGHWSSPRSYLARVLRPLLLPWRSRSPALGTPRWLTPGSSYRHKPFPTPRFSALQLVLRQCWLLLSASPVVAARAQAEAALPLPRTSILFLQLLLTAGGCRDIVALKVLPRGTLKQSPCHTKG